MGIGSVIRTHTSDTISAPMQRVWVSSWVGHKITQGCTHARVAQVHPRCRCNVHDVVCIRRIPESYSLSLSLWWSCDTRGCCCCDHCHGRRPSVSPAIVVVVTPWHWPSASRRHHCRVLPAITVVIIVILLPHEPSSSL